MVSDLMCPECRKAVHPCSHDYHVTKCLFKKMDEISNQMANLESEYESCVFDIQGRLQNILGTEDIYEFDFGYKSCINSPSEKCIYDEFGDKTCLFCKEPK